MCGIVVIATTGDGPGPVDAAVVDRMRDRLAHRGPDGAGTWSAGPVTLAHRRLAVVDPSPAGAQPMTTPDGRYAITYNGELYNDRTLRDDLARQGVRLRTACDTETVLHALARWGRAGLDRLRGMFALAFYDSAERRLLLARDPLGVKPLYWWSGVIEGRTVLAAASEIPALLQLPAISPRPDLQAVSAYLTTIRTTLGERSMLADVSTLTPGQVLEVSLTGESPTITRSVLTADRHEEGAADAVGSVRAAVVDSVLAHLRADVPTCALLSGGLDSSILCAIAAGRSEGGRLRTYCSGAPSGSAEDDLAMARGAAAHLGSDHAEAPITRDLFLERWRWMVEAMGLPLSTPNEVAIHEVARRLRADGCVVALSGEGADELFGGYEAPLRGAAAFVAGGTGEDPGLFQLESCAWIAPRAKSHVLRAEAWRSVERDESLREFYRETFAQVAAERADGDALQAHLRFHRRINLAGLLLRLDSATMLASVEGRTPYADRVVAGLAEALPMDWKFRLMEDGSAQTKRVLREAFAGDLPAAVVSRRKASFPLPFEGWMESACESLSSSWLARELFAPEAVELVVRDPARTWVWAWPMVNVAMWGARWW